MQFFLSSINSLFDHYHISVSVMIQFHNKKRNGHVIQIFVYELNQLKYWNFQWRKRTANCYLYPIKVTRFDINKWNEKAQKNRKWDSIVINETKKAQKIRKSEYINNNKKKLFRYLRILLLTTVWYWCSHIGVTTLLYVFIIYVH